MNETVGEECLFPNFSDCFSACFISFSITICAILIFTTACRLGEMFLKFWHILETHVLRHQMSIFMFF
jgi:hypothetical protein